MHTRIIPSILRLFEFFTIAFSALLPVNNPVGSAIIFLGLVGPADGVVYRHLAWRVAIFSVLFLTAVDLVGALLLAFFGISLPVVQVAGGLVLASMGWKLLNNPDPPDPSDSVSATRSLKALDAEIFYPFTFPLTAGPGTIVVTLALAAHAERRVSMESVIDQFGLFLAILALGVLIYFAYGYAPVLTRKISPQTSHGILRIISFILLAIGVQIFWRGAEGLLHQAFPH